MMYSGYVKLWRKSMESAVWHNDQLWKLWCYCLLKANHKPRWVSVYTGRGKTEEFVKTGQFIFGSKRAGKDLNQKWQSTYKRLKKLEKLGNLKTQSKTHYTIVTICNWEIYQSTKNNCENPDENPSKNQVKTKENPSKTNNNDKNERNKEAKEVLSYLNKKCNRKFTNIDPVIPRLKEGKSVEDCKKIIDIKMHDPHFIKNPQYMNPTTLFRKSHWDTYINQKVEDFEDETHKQENNPIYKRLN